jgi:hypothetical protein
LVTPGGAGYLPRELPADLRATNVNHWLARATRSDRTGDIKARQVTLLAQPVRLPSPDDLLGRVFDLERRLAGDPPIAREELRRLFDGRHLRLDPQPERHHVARGGLLPGDILAEKEKSASGKGRFSKARVAGARFELATFG